MTTWQSLHKKFNALEEKAGRSKSNNFFLSVVFSAVDSITVTLGTSDIPGWTRVTHLGPFDCEKLALDTAREKINEATQIINAVTAYSKEIRHSLQTKSATYYR